MEAEVCLEQLRDAVNLFCGQLREEAEIAEIAAGKKSILGRLLGVYDLREEARMNTFWDVRNRLIALIEKNAPSDWEDRKSLVDVEKRKSEIVQAVARIEMKSRQDKELLLMEWQRIAREGEMLPNSL